MISPVVSNSSPLIALAQIRQLDLLRRLFATLLVPPAVAAETAPTLALPEWIITRPIEQPVAPQVLRASLGAGESESITLAVEVQAHWIILDDRPARRLADAIGIPVIGTLGILLASKRKGFLPSLRPCLDALKSCHFHISPELHKRALADAGELP